MEVPVSKELWLNYPASGFPITTSVSPEAPGRKYTTLCWHLPGHTQSVPPSSRARPWQALRSTGTWRRVQDTVKPQRIWACPSPLRQSWRNPQKEEVCPDHKAFVKRTPGRQLSQVPSWRGPHRISPKKRKRTSGEFALPSPQSSYRSWRSSSTSPITLTSMSVPNWLPGLTCLKLEYRSGSRIREPSGGSRRRVGTSVPHSSLVRPAWPCPQTWTCLVLCWHPLLWLHWYLPQNAAYSLRLSSLQAGSLHRFPLSHGTHGTYSPCLALSPSILVSLPSCSHPYTPSGAASVQLQHRDWFFSFQASNSPLSVMAGSPGPQRKSLHNPSMTHSPGSYPELAIKDCTGYGRHQRTARVSPASQSPNAEDWLTKGWGWSPE